MEKLKGKVPGAFEKDAMNQILYGVKRYLEDIIPSLTREQRERIVEICAQAMIEVEEEYKK